jgi:hypothetical protein
MRLGAGIVIGACILAASAAMRPALAPNLPLWAREISVVWSPDP